jgi:hypothetical protein
MSDSAAFDADSQAHTPAHECPSARTPLSPLGADAAHIASAVRENQTDDSLKEGLRLVESLSALRARLAAFPHDTAARNLAQRIDCALRACEDGAGLEGEAVGQRTPEPPSETPALDPGGQFTPPGYWNLPWNWLQSEGR